jgi:hypothetical protein
MIECRHSSAISVSAHWNSALAGLSSYTSRRIICCRISSNQIPVEATDAASCLVSSRRCGSVSSSQYGVP